MGTTDEQIKVLSVSMTASFSELKKAIEALSVTIGVTVEETLTLIENGEIVILPSLEFVRKDFDFDKLLYEDCFIDRAFEEIKEWNKTGWGYKPKYNPKRREVHPKKKWFRTRSNPVNKRGGQRARDKHRNEPQRE